MGALESSNSYIYAQSSIFSNNAVDVSLVGNTQMYGNDNLVQTMMNLRPNIGLIVSSADPHLTPLAYHWATTKSHALLLDSGFQ